VEVQLEEFRRALKAAGAERVFSEKQSGAKTDRRELAKAIASLGQGDVLLVTRLDRLARSTRDCLMSWQRSQRRVQAFDRLPIPWADTTTAHGELMITILGGLAEFDRSLILARTSEGRTRAIARRVRFGRKPKLSQFQIAEAIARRSAGEALTEIGRSYNVSHSTISRL
jgi:DNA invertase Pin-like site-specific DNA recombinase